jgi:molecular chaperone GrpE (heat shock protein)
LIDPSTHSDDADTSTPAETPEVVVAPAAEVAVAATPADKQEPTQTEAALEALDGRVAAAETRLTELAGELGTSGNRTDAAESRLTSIEESAAASAESIAAAIGRVTAAEGRFDVTKGRLDATDALVREHIESIAGRLTAVDGRLAAVDDHLAALRRRAADHDSALEDISRSIAAEVERHTSDALVDSQHSLQLAVNSIAQLALAMAESARDITEDVSAESATALLDSFRIDLDAILAQLGFESLATTVGATFDPHRHRALKRVATKDAAADKAITRVIRDGYISAATGRILLFADVEVSRYRAQ